MNSKNLKLTYNNFCNNCGKTGHLLADCKNPITSIGIISFRYNTTNNCLEYLLIQRNDSFGFVEFIRGKYPLFNLQYIQTLINEMTVEEKNKLLNMTFEEMWKLLWGDFSSLQYRGEETSSKDKFETLKKGIKIKDIDCGIREFIEETGYSPSDFKLIENIIPYEEMFIGSNIKSYKHKYYLANMCNNTKEIQDYQKSEVRNIKWVSFEECINYIRPYNLEKINIIQKINKVLQEYRLY